MKAKKFRVTLTVLSIAVFSILKYCSKTYYQLVDWEFCSHEEDWGPWAQSHMSRSTWAESFKGSNATAEFPGYSTTSKGTELENAGPAAQHGTAKEMFVSLRARQQNVLPYRAVASSGAAGGGSFPSTSRGSTGLSPGMLEFSLRLTCICDSH